MKILNTMKFRVFLLIILMPLIFIPISKAYAFSNPTTVPLLTVANFSALAHILISSPSGPTVLNNGDLGVDSPGTCTNFPNPCIAVGNGTINSGAIQYRNAVAPQGQTDATAAVTNIGSRVANQTLTAQLGGRTLTQGVYQVPAAATNLTGNLTLNGDANSVFIFHLTSTLITDSGSKVILTGGAQACNVFWKVDSSAVFNGTTTFVGTVLAHTSVTFPGGGATLNGRAIAQGAAITFNRTTVNNSSCATPSPTITPSPANSPTPTPTIQPSPSPSPCDVFHFPSCVSVLPKPGDIAHYTSGNHQIVGGLLLSGSDDVYSLEKNNFLQCFCPVVGYQGVQTNWLRTDHPIYGWFFVNGTQWNLGNFNYAAQNISFTCLPIFHSPPTPTPTLTPTFPPKPTFPPMPTFPPKEYTPIGL